MSISLQRASADATFNLDSLLDTITCLIGVLLIVMAIAYVGLARKPASATGEEVPAVVTPAMMDLRKQELERLGSELVKIRRELGVLNANAPIIHSKTVVIEKEITEIRAVLPPTDEAKAKGANIEKERATLLAEESALKKAIAALRAQLAKLQHDVEARQVATVVTLPETRSVKGSFERAAVLIRYGRIYVLDTDQLSNAFGSALREAVKSFTPAMNPGARIDHLIEHINRNTIGTDTVRLRAAKLFNGQGQQVAGLRVRFEFKRERGETIADAQREGSTFQTFLRSIDSKKHYLDFDVWADSFETFLAARRVASEAHRSVDGSGTTLGMHWTFFATDEEFTFPWTNSGTQAKPTGITIDN